MADTVVRYVHHVDLVGNEIRNARVQGVVGLPTPIPERAGWIVFNTVDGRLYYCTGTSWELRATNSDALGSQAPAFYLARANHTGQMPASAVSGLEAAIEAVPLNELSPPTGPINLNNQELQHAGAATAPTSVPNWGQVVDLVANLGFKHVKLASTGNVAITSTGAGALMDGTALQLGDLVLLKDQTDPVENGIYRVGATAVGRDPNNDTAAKMPSGTVVVVDQGTTNGERMFMLTTAAGFVVGIDPLTFSPFGVAPNPYTAGDGISIVATTISAVAGPGIIVDSSGIRIDPAILPNNGFYQADLPPPAPDEGVLVTHNLGRAPVPVAVMEIATGNAVVPGVRYLDVNTVELWFSVAPLPGEYRVGIG